MNDTTTNNHAIENGRGWYATICDQLQRLKTACDSGDDDAYDAIRDEIMESPLCATVRSGWHNVGETSDPSEFCLLLSTGGPALRIVGELGLFNCPERSRMEWQDWGTPWTEYQDADSAILDSWAAQFYWGD